MTLPEVFNLTVLSLVATAILAPFLIEILYSFNFVVRHKLMPNKMNAEFIRLQAHKSGTPTMGGIMISISVFLIAAFFIPPSSTKTVFLMGWGIFALYGLADGLLVYARKVSANFKMLQESFSWRAGKLTFLWLLNFIAIYTISMQLGVKEISFFNLFVIELNAAALMFGGFCMSIAMYGMEINDGLDGLVTGEFIISLLGLGFISLLTVPVLLPYVGIIIGSCIVYLYFNISPARVFMGGPGTFPIAFALLFFALVMDVVDIFLIIGIVYWLEVISSAMQIISIRFFKKKIFRIAPIHHHFEAIGWPETKVVQRFWLAAATFAVLALWIYTNTRL